MNQSPMSIKCMYLPLSYAKQAAQMIIILHRWVQRRIYISTDCTLKKWLTRITAITANDPLCDDATKWLRAFGGQT